MIWFLAYPVFMFYFIKNWQIQTSHPNDMDFLPIQQWNFFHWLAGIFMFLFVSFVFLGIMYVISAEIMSPCFNLCTFWKYQTTGSRDLVAMKEGDGVAGSVGGGIFMLSGSFESEPYYFYYTKTSTGEIAPGKSKVNDNVRIVESEASNPRLVVDRQAPPWWCKIFAIMDERPERSTFYVPAGSIEKSFKLQGPP